MVTKFARKKSVTINGKVIGARRQQDLTQEQLAQRLGVNHIDIVRIEQGWLPPSTFRQRIATILEESEDTLFGDILRPAKG